MNIAVYCASSENAPQKYYDMATEVGAILAKQNHTVYYGGACVGLMGKVADGALENGGKVVGVIPQFMTNMERHHKGLTETIWVETMQERKRIMFTNSDAVIALAGGCGTWEELLEVLTLKRLNLFSGEIIIVNTDGFYDPIIEMLQRTVDEKFMTEEHLKLFKVIETPSELVALLH
jgi:uncharacterized protein (TIGR00730 family)